VRPLAKKPALLDYANGQLNLAQLYNALESPAAGNWKELEHDHAITNADNDFAVD